MSNKIHFTYIALLLLTIGAGLFGSLSDNKENRELKRENKASVLLVQDYEKTIKQLMDHIEETERIDSIEAIKDSAMIQRIKSLDITTINANHRTIINMPSDSFMLLLTSFIDSAGAATR